MKQRCAFLGLLVSLLLLAGCGRDAVAPGAHQTPPPAMPEIPASHLRLRIRMPLSDLQAALNQKTAQQIFALQHQKVKCGIGHCRLSARFVRSAPLILSGSAAGQLQLRLPFQGQATLKLPGLLSGVKAKAVGAGEIRMKSRLRLDASAHIQPHSEGEVWFRPDGFSLGLGGVHTNLAALWNANRKSLSKPLFRALDHQIVRHLKTRTALQRLWLAGFRPIRVGRDPAIWLVPEPQALAVGALAVQGKTLTLPVGLDLKASLKVQPDAPQTSPAPLPPLTALNGAEDHYRIVLPLLISYDRAAALAQSALQAHPLHFSGIRVQIKDLKFLPSGQDVIVRTRFCARPYWDVLHLFSSCGTVFLRGTPVYDGAHREVGVQHLHYDLQSKNLLLAGVGRLAKLAGPDLARMLEKHGRFDLSSEIGRLRDRLAHTLSAGVGRDVVLRGHLNQLELRRLSWTKDGFVALLVASGSVQGQVELRR